MIRVIQIDDEPMNCATTEMLLRDVDFIDLIMTCTSAEEGLAAVVEHEPDVVLLDVRMPRVQGDEVARIIVEKSPETRILAMTQHDEKEVVKRMVRSGVFGYVVKGLGKYELLEAINSVANGEPYFTRNVANLLLEDQLNNSVDVKEADMITKRETEVLKLVSEGFTNKEIGVKLNISERTVDAHRRNMLEKLNAKNSSELINKGFRLGLI